MRKPALFYRTVLFLLCCLLALAGCTGQPPPAAGAAQIRIGVSVYDAYDTFIGELMGHFRAYVQRTQQAEEITITVMEENAAGSQATQNSQVDGFIEAGCDVICVNLVDRTEASTIIDAAKTAGIPVVFFNRELVEEDLERWDKLYYVGAPAMQSGQIQGQIIVDLCEEDFDAVDKNGDGVLQYVMLEGEAGHQDATLRTEHAVGTVQKAGFRLERVAGEIANWNRPQAETKMALWIEAYGSAIEVVFANNDDMALGAIDALVKSGLAQNDWPVVVGIDGTPVGLAAVAAGQMTGTVHNDAAGQAKAMFDLARSLAQNQPPPAGLPIKDGKYVRLDYNRITEENVDFYLEEPGDTG